MIGVFNMFKALGFAIGKGFDLVKISDGPTPVVKLADFNKMLFEQKKKQKEAKKNQVIQKLKEMTFKVNIAENDFNTKINHISEFLKDNDKVKIIIKMERRLAESSPELGFDLMNNVIGALTEFGFVQDKPKKQGNLIFALIEPNKK